MGYRWKQADGTSLGNDLDEVFEGQSEAEDWLSSFYSDLVDAGITEVSLYEEERLVYGPMSLLAG